MTDSMELRDLAGEVAADTAKFLLGEVHKHHSAETKSSPSDMVTEVDRAAESRIVAAITRTRPNDGFRGEEGTDRPGTTGVRWIIDPIDGTTNFVFGHPGYGVSIAAEHNGTVVAGAVADPVHGQLFDAALGHGARCNATAIKTRASTEIGRTLVATGFSFSADIRRHQAKALVVILPGIADIRRMGSAALDLCGVASGRVDAYYELGLNEWDFAAGALIAAEAGARVMRPTATTGPGSLIVAAAPGIATDFLALLDTAGVAQ